MKIQKIKVNNYRLLKEFTIDLEDVLSLVIGKNNCGKTSLLFILDRFLSNKPTFSYDDFNLGFQNELRNKIETGENNLPSSFGISMKLFITYDENDDLSNISKVMMDLIPENNTIVLKFEYVLHEDDLKKLRNDFEAYKLKQIERCKKKEDKADDKKENKNSPEPKDCFDTFLKKNHKEYFKAYRKTIAFDFENRIEKDEEFIDLDKEKISLDKIINFRLIRANRDVSNSDSDKALSVLSSKYYEKQEGNQKDSIEIENFKETLSDTDEQLDEIYKGLFEKIIDKVGKFGGVRKGDSIIKIISTLQHKELLKGNTTVMYDHNGNHSLPENYNGLGYMNLISMIFEIEVLLSDFRKEGKNDENPADINILFIEEPEAHTHPQMQYVFIKNIKNLLTEACNGTSGAKFNLQTIITTHSSHIVAESNFNDIKYFYKKEANQVIVKNIKDLESEYKKDEQGKQNYKFLKQYLTLHRAELFFADKAIFIEGDTERILLPAMMKKIDQDEKENPMLSQNISIIEVGNYSHIFEKFIHFIGIKSLIITDIDSAHWIEKEKDEKVKKVEEKCRVEEKDASVTTNASLKFFHNQQTDIEYYKKLKFDWKILRKKITESKEKWVSNRKGNVLMVYQTHENDYYARSFEDSFFNLNRQFIVDNKASFKSLKHIGYFDDPSKDAFALAEECIDKKPSFAIEILLNSEVDTNGNEFSNWQIPDYIKQGLLWLKKN